jgi:hypothetical protein
MDIVLDAAAGVALAAGMKGRLGGGAGGGAVEGAGQGSRHDFQFFQGIAGKEIGMGETVSLEAAFQQAGHVGFGHGVLRVRRPGGGHGFFKVRRSWGGDGFFKVRRS